ncbi:MAG: hypothetical protein U0441_00980 [Polyangiaceae bacterium]
MRARPLHAVLVGTIWFAPVIAAGQPQPAQAAQPAPQPAAAFGAPAKLQDLTSQDVQQCDSSPLLTSGFRNVSGDGIARFCTTLRESPTTLRSDDLAARALREKRGCEVVEGMTLPIVQGCRRETILNYCGGRRDPDEACAPGALNDILNASGHAFGAAAATNSTSLILNGMTDFFLARAQQELVLFLRDRLVGDLCDKGPWERLLPATCEALAPGGTTSSSATLLGLPTALRNDLDRLPIGLFDVAVPASPFACVARAAIGLAEPLRQGVSLSRALKGLPQDAPHSCDGQAAVWQEVRAAAGLAGAYLAKVEGGAGLTQDDLKLLLGQFAAGLPTPASGAAPDVKWLEAMVPKVDRMLAALDRVRKQSSSDTAIREALIATYDVVGDVLAHAAESSSNATLKKLTGDVRGSVSAAEAFASRDYTTAVLRLFSIPSLKTIFDGADVPEDTKKLLAGLTRHAQLVAALAQAKTPEEAQKALESAAAPLGSYREYRRRSGAGFLGAMLGISGGYEISPDPKGTSGAVIAPFLPVGLEIGLTPPSASSLNLMFSVIDIGGLASARLSDQTGGSSGKDKQAKVVPDPNFLSVFAPGVTLAWGISDSPFVLGLGATFAPAQRPFFACTGTCGQTETLATIRVHAFVGIDLPVLPLF